MKSTQSAYERYQAFLSSYQTALSQNPKLSLKQHTQVSEISYQGFLKWMKTQQLTAKSIKQGLLKQESGQSAVESEFIQLVPNQAESNEITRQTVLENITITLGQASCLTIPQISPQDLATLLLQYRKQEGLCLL